LLELAEIEPKTIQTLRPFGTALVYPPLRQAEALRVNPAGPHAPGFFRDDKAGIRENIQMLKHRRQRHAERRCKLAHRGRAHGEVLNNGAPRWVGQSLESAVKGGLLVKHMLNYMSKNS
jgi:hypothetical protein